MPIYSYERFIASGETADFNINFDYLSSSHIEVYLDGVQQSSTGLSPDFSIDSSTNKVTFTSTPASGAVVLIKRVTPKDKAEYQAQIADFTDGSVLTAKDLDNASLGLLFIAQEAEDSGNTNALSIDQNDLQWDAENKRIKNVGTPTGSSDATTKSYVDGQALYNNPTVPQVYTFEASADQTEFTLDPQPTSSDPDSFFVDIDGSMKRPTADFTVSGDTLTLTTGASNGQLVTVRNIGVTRDILGDNPTVTGNLSVSGTLGSTGAATMSSTLGVTGATTLSSTAAVGGAATLSSTLGVTGATTLSGGVSGNLNLLDGILQMAGNGVMTIRQITTATYDESAGSDHTITSTSDYKIYGLSTTITPKSPSSHIIIIATPRVDGFVDNGGSSDLNLNLYLALRTDGDTQNAAGATMAGSLLGGSLWKILSRSHKYHYGYSLSPSGNDATSAGVITTDQSLSSEHTNVVTRHHHDLNETQPDEEYLYLRHTMVFHHQPGSTTQQRYDVVGQCGNSASNLKCRPTSGSSNIIAIEIG